MLVDKRHLHLNWWNFNEIPTWDNGQGLTRFTIQQHNTVSFHITPNYYHQILKQIFLLKISKQVVWSCECDSRCRCSSSVSLLIWNRRLNSSLSQHLFTWTWRVTLSITMATIDSTQMYLDLATVIFVVFSSCFSDHQPVLCWHIMRPNWREIRGRIWD